MVALRKLDRAAKMPAQVFAYTFGTLCALVAGAGMCLSMGVVGPGTVLSIGLGIAVGVVGFAGVAVNYPIYRRILLERKEKYAGDIIRLANEIAGGED